MSKNALVSLTVVLCVAAAGVGGYLATKSRTVATQTPTGTTAPVLGSEPITSPSVSVTPSAPQPAAVSAAAVQADSVEPAPAVRSTTPARPAGPKGDVPKTTAVERTPAAAEQPRPAAVPVVPQAGTPPVEAQTPPPATETPVPVVPPAESSVTATSSQPPAPEPQFDEVEVEADSVLGIKVDSTVHSETARVEDPVEAHVSRDLRVGSIVAVPAGSRVLGVVTQVERGGKMRNRSRLAIRFHTLVLPDGTRTTIQSEPIFREGEGPGQEAAGKVGAAAAGGALLGAILGGRKGALIGGSVGAAGGTAAVMAGDRNAAVLKAGTSLTIRLVRPVTVLVGR